jgi:hypothetical protein
VIVGRLEGLVGFRIGQFLEAAEFLAARNVNDQVARDGQQPRLKFGLGIVLVAAFEHANPRFLEKIFGQRGVAGKKQKITIQALLVLLNQAIENLWIALAEAVSQDLAFVSHEPGEEYRGPCHR